MERYRREKKTVSASWGIVQDDRGRILGKLYARSPMLETDVQIVKKFLSELQKEKTEMVKQNGKPASADRVNMAFLAGEIKTLKVRDDNSAYLLIDPTGDDKAKWIPCTAHNDAELCERLGKFDVGDYIQVRGYVRAWSQKKNDEWQNHVEIRITEVRNTPPVREKKKPSPAPAREPVQSMLANDEDVPF